MFIDESATDSRVRYAKILRAQLSEFELTLLFYNCLSENGEDSFKELVENYAFLEQFSGKLLLNRDHLNLYKPWARSDAEAFARFGDGPRGRVKKQLLK